MPGNIYPLTVWDLLQPTRRLVSREKIAVNCACLLSGIAPSHKFFKLMACNSPWHLNFTYPKYSSRIEVSWQDCKVIELVDKQSDVHANPRPLQE